MLVYTDSVEYARTVTGEAADAWRAAPAFPDDGVRHIAETTFNGAPIRASTMAGAPTWRYLLLTATAPRSQYDALIDVGRRVGRLPGGVLMLAGAGERFHGFRSRPWAAAPGNLHLTIHLTPTRAVAHPGTAFTVLAAVSVIDAIDAMPGLAGRAGIKWVNDILIDGAKIGGVLAHTHTVGGRVTRVVLGIGVNVETDPVLEPTPYVPHARSLRSCSARPDACRQGPFFARLTETLDRNYRRLSDGAYGELLDRYRERSLVVGREVTICTESSGSEPDVIATGRVAGLGDDLEIHLDGVDTPLTKGRLILGRPWNPPSSS
jgi:BirA family biotin operon repressor/biotin-[acetyl-CoA-carboxylase] ligase